MDYINTELSRLIASKVPEVKTGKWQTWDTYRARTYYEFVDNLPMYNTENGRSWCRAYRLYDVLRAIQVWGEKQGYNEAKWKCEHYNEKANEPGERGCASLKCSAAGWKDMDEACHRLLTAYLADGLQFGPRSEEVIRSIFT